MSDNQSIPWEELSRWRWGPAAGDKRPGLDVGRDRPLRPLGPAPPPGPIVDKGKARPPRPGADAEEAEAIRDEA